MSIESANLFIERMKTDEKFSNKVLAYKNEAECKAFIKESGFDFTTAEYYEARGELTDKELDNVAGGLSISWPSGDILKSPRQHVRRDHKGSMGGVRG